MIRVGCVSLGAPHHGKIFVNNMNANLKHYGFTFLEPMKEYGWAHLHPEQIDVLWFYGFHALPDALISNFKKANPKMKVVVTWVGSDILELFNFLHFRPYCKSCLIQNIDVHIADGQRLVEELTQVEIKATYIPSIPQESWQLKPLPEKFSVAAYVPGFRADFFNFEMIASVAEKMGDVEFHLFGGGPVTLAVDVMRCPNLFYHGWVEGEAKKKWWENSSVLLYMPKHGSLGVTAVEFLQMGRYVICPEEYPYVIECKTVEDLLLALTGLKDVKEPHVEASKYYQSEYSPERQAEKVKQILDRL